MAARSSCVKNGVSCTSRWTSYRNSLFRNNRTRYRLRSDRKSKQVSATYERHLRKQGCMPYGIQKVDVGPEGGTIKLQSKADSRINFENEDVIQLVVPKDAIRRQGGRKLPIRYGVLLNGKFKVKAGYKLVSHVVYVNYDPKDITKPLKLQLPHWSSEEDVFIATASQDDNEGGNITFNLKDDMVSSSSRNAAVSSVSGSELYAVAVREGSKSNFYAIPHEIPIKDGRRVELSVIISYASTVWCEILCEHYFPDGNFPYPCPEFKFLDSTIHSRLATDGGPGWEAKLCGYSEIGQDHTAMEFHDIKNGDQLKKAMTYKSYPPRFVCKVNWTAKAEESGQRRQVEVFIEGSNPKLSFSCLTFEDSSTSSESSEDKTNKSRSKSSRSSKSNRKRSHQRDGSRQKRNKPSEETVRAVPTTSPESSEDETKKQKSRSSKSSKSNRKQSFHQLGGSRQKRNKPIEETVEAVPTTSPELSEDETKKKRNSRSSKNILQKPITECDDYEILLLNCVANYIGSNLNALSTNLGLKLTTRDGFISKHPRDIISAAEEVLNYWAKGNTKNKSPTWLDLFAAMEKSKMAGEVKSLKDELLKRLS